MKIEHKVSNLLISKKLTLCVAESCTGGLISHLLTNIPGSSSFLMSSIIAYSNESKIKQLKVKCQTIKKYGAVSEQTAIEMARGARKLHDTDFGLATTGIAGPTGASKQKPIGLCYIAISTNIETICLKCQFQGERLQIKKKATNQILKLLLEFLT